MYGYNDNLNGCLQISSKGLGGCLDVSVGRIGDGINAIAERIGEGIGFSVMRIGGGLSVACSIVCNVNTSNYVRVEPQYLWLTPANDFTDDVDVISNVVWDVI